jgi:uncharacterized LabA/DUF88 family protein
MDRCAVFIDAGYLIAEGAKGFLAPSATRGDVAVDFEALIGRLTERAISVSGLPLLRIYWYDGAPDGIPTSDQLAISALPDVKLRLGRISGGRQKGVDALVYRDLSVLARERSIVTAFLLAGDEDLREGVVTAQELGVHLTLWGLGRQDNQARTLAAEADRVVALDAELLRAVQAVHGNLRGRDALRRAARAGFWTEVARPGSGGQPTH